MALKCGVKILGQKLIFTLEAMGNLEEELVQSLTVTYRLAWPHIDYPGAPWEAKELLILLLLPPKSWSDKHAPPTPVNMVQGSNPGLHAW